MRDAQNGWMEVNARILGLCEGDAEDDVHHHHCKAQGQPKPQHRDANVDPGVLRAILHGQHDFADPVIHFLSESCIQACAGAAHSLCNHEVGVCKEMPFHLVP